MRIFDDSRMRVHDASFSHIVQQLFFLRESKTAPEYPLDHRGGHLPPDELLRV